MTHRYRPSPEALTMAVDPANRDVSHYDPALLPQMRRDIRAEASAAMPELVAKWGLTLGWREIGGVTCLVITPDQRADDPDILYLFGGGFITGGPVEDLMISGKLAAMTGRTVISPAYRLAPEHPFPAALHDVEAVARTMTAPLTIAGESAGGNLALALAIRLIRSGAIPEKLALLSPAADMTEEFDPHAAPDDPFLSPHLVDAVPVVYASDLDKTNPEISPIHNEFNADWPPTLITTGTRDRFAGQCAALARAIREAGAPADLRLWDSLWHVFEYYDIPEADLSLREIAAFITGDEAAR
jgi:epsilon-lactone hydrolase